MKIHLYSDTHGHPYEPKVEADVIVNAGDYAFHELDYEMHECEGNHDFYGKEPKNRQHSCHYTVQEVIFLSCTLWTNFWGKKMRLADTKCFVNNLNDFHLIKGMTIPKMVKLFNNDFEFLKQEVEKFKDKKIVIVTHFAPSKKSIHPKHDGNVLNPYFVNDLDEFILANPQIKLWCHAHTHCSLDYMIGDTRVVCNALGYKNDDGSFENPEFNKDLIIEI